MRAFTRASLVYGVGALRAAARGDRIVWALHRAALANGIVPVVPPGRERGIPHRGPGDRLEALLAGSEVEQLRADGARRVGELAARADTTDIVAVSVAETAARRNGAVVAARQNALRDAAALLGHELVLYAV